MIGKKLKEIENKYETSLKKAKRMLYDDFGFDFPPTSSAVRACRRMEKEAVLEFQSDLRKLHKTVSPHIRRTQFSVHTRIQKGELSNSFMKEVLAIAKFFVNGPYLYYDRKERVYKSSTLASECIKDATNLKLDSLQILFDAGMCVDMKDFKEFVRNSNSYDARDFPIIFKMFLDNREGLKKQEIEDLKLMMATHIRDERNLKECFDYLSAKEYYKKKRQTFIYK